MAKKQESKIEDKKADVVANAGVKEDKKKLPVKEAKKGVSLKETRQDKISKAVDGKTFTFVTSEASIVKGEFVCICGGKGKNAYELKDQDGNVIKVGKTCLKHCNVELPKKKRKLPVRKVHAPDKATKNEKVEAKNETPIVESNTTEDSDFTTLD